VRLSLAALGVVYGDIGTSPLYAFRECFKPEYGLAPTASNVYGVLSLIVWSLILIVSVKYLVLIIRLDNRGEGGIMALLALVLSIRRRQAVIAIGLFGAALLYGDGIITPAISVLSATEGLGIAAPAFQPYVMPAALVLLFLLFSVQKYGTAGVGGVFGPIMLVWFTTIGLLGAIEIVRAPAILLALNPWYGARLFWEHRAAAFLVLGAVVLAVTGAEALYADLGHFGRRPIRLAWFAFVLPTLLLNYFGQGGLVLSTPEAIESPFYLLAPRVLLYPLVGIATAATVAPRSTTKCSTSTPSAWTNSTPRTKPCRSRGLTADAVRDVSASAIVGSRGLLLSAWKPLTRGSTTSCKWASRSLWLTRLIFVSATVAGTGICAAITGPAGPSRAKANSQRSNEIRFACATRELGQSEIKQESQCVAQQRGLRNGSPRA